MDGTKAPNVFVSVAEVSLPSSQPKRLHLTIDHLWLGMPVFALAYKLFRFPLPVLDFWWHLKMGEIIATTGSIPRVDLFSFTAAGKPFVVQNWLAELIFYTTYKLGGFPLIIFLTALGRGEEHIRTGYNLGAVDYIVKPFVPEILRTKVGVFVELNRKSALLQQQSELLERRNQELQDAIKRSWEAEEEIKELNRHLEGRVNELAELNRELEAFSFTASHDLRGPLSRIAGFSRALLDFHTEQLDETGKQYLERIDQSATKMAELVGDLLKFSRIPRVEMSPDKLNLSDMVRSIASELTARETSRQVEFVIEDAVTGWGDHALVRAALWNLMDNAWKYTRKSSAPRIEFGLHDRVGSVYYVRDNGAGFNMAEADRLFNPFQRLHKDTEFEGTGIGLATVDRIIRRHGGRIWAQGEVGQGATFFFTLGQETSS